MIKCDCSTSDQFVSFIAVVVLNFYTILHQFYEVAYISWHGAVSLSIGIHNSIAKSQMRYFKFSVYM